ncbi:MAG: hypothetical protein QOG99_1334 [Frankiales bacterium]|nr:hypothetical protein [Frankiales bacterium]
MSTRAFTHALDRVAEGRPYGRFQASAEQGAALAAAIALHLIAAPGRVPDQAFVRSLAERLRRAEPHVGISRPRPAKIRAWREPTVSPEARAGVVPGRPPPAA